jgi:phosphatidylserine/phosphatidylglycerophosphate/cardiolipin synthase-like enzyme
MVASHSPADQHLGGLRERSSGSEQRAPLAYWRDTDIQVEGAAVAEFQRLFSRRMELSEGAAAQLAQLLSPNSPGGQPDRAGDRQCAGTFSLIYVTLIFGNSQFGDQRLYHRRLLCAGPSNAATRLSMLPGAATCACCTPPIGRAADRVGLTFALPGITQVGREDLRLARRNAAREDRGHRWGIVNGLGTSNLDCGASPAATSSTPLSQSFVRRQNGSGVQK